MFYNGIAGQMIVAVNKICQVPCIMYTSGSEIDGKSLSLVIPLEDTECVGD